MQAKQVKTLETLLKPIKFIIKAGIEKTGCYNSYPLTGISSRDSGGLASREIRIGLEFKNRVSQQTPQEIRHLCLDGGGSGGPRPPQDSLVLSTGARDIGSLRTSFALLGSHKPRGQCHAGG
jgi:hypothetical protein